MANPIPLDIAAIDALRNLPGEVDGLIAGFQRLLRNDGGNSIWYDFLGDKAPTHHLRQLSSGTTLEWETAAVSRSPQKSMTCFVFAGSFGAFNEPVTGGFLLTVNESGNVVFDLTATDCLWQNSQQTVALLFQMRWSSAEGAAGFFYVGVSSDLVTPEKPCRISVSALGSDSERWFGVNPITNPVELQAASRVVPVDAAMAVEAGGPGSQADLPKPADDDLTRLVNAWPTLTENTRRAIIDMLDGTQ